MLLLIQDDQLHYLDDEMSALNIFELVGLKNQEIRHSNFLSELLNPNSILNIGDIVLKTFIRDAFKLINTDSINTLTPIDFELIDFDNFEVRREYKNIDLLLLNHGNSKSKYCICIENKVDSGESKEQLFKYRTVVDNEFTDYKKLYLFLTPEGLGAEYDSDWISLSYSSIIMGLKKVLKNTSLNNDVRLLITHYLALLEKYVIGQTELQKLAREIYFKHKSAFDFIFENRPDKVSELSKEIYDWLLTNSDKLDVSVLQYSKTVLRFVTPEMKSLSKLIPGNGWETNDIICMEVVLRNQSLTFKVMLGKSDDFMGRENFLTFLQKKLDVKSTSKQWSTVFSKKICSENLDEVDDIKPILSDTTLHLERLIPEQSDLLCDAINEYILVINKV